MIRVYTKGRKGGRLLRVTALGNCIAANASRPVPWCRTGGKRRIATGRTCHHAARVESRRREDGWVGTVDSGGLGLDGGDHDHGLTGGMGDFRVVDSMVLALAPAIGRSDKSEALFAQEAFRFGGGRKASNIHITVLWR